VGIAISVFGIYKLRGWKRPMVTFENLKPTKLTASGNVVTASISPDGKAFAYVTTDGAKQTLWIKQLTTDYSNKEIIPSSDGDYLGLSFSPDGKFIYYVRSRVSETGSVFKVPAVGGAPIRLAPDVDSPVSLSTDAKHMAYVRSYPDQKETALIVAPIEGSTERKLAVMKSPYRLELTSGPAWSPDGKDIAVVSKDEPYQHVLVVNVADGRIRSIDNAGWPQIGRVSWAHDGNSLVVTAADQESQGSQLWQISYPAGQTKRITNDLTDYQQPTLSRDSRQILVIQRERQSNLWITSAGRRREGCPDYYSQWRRV
jgi:Tol biopolymer transport system component